MADEVRFTLRLPADIAATIREMAGTEDRSLHAECVHQLRLAALRWRRARRIGQSGQSTATPGAGEGE